MSFNPFVYLVDDDEVNYFLVQRVLENIDPAFQVICFPTADAALQALVTTKSGGGFFPAFILVDLYLPIQDGWYFVEQYQHLLKHSVMPSAVFILSCSTYPRDLEKATKYTCITDFLIKPFTEELVRSKLNPFFQHSKRLYKG